MKTALLIDAHALIHRAFHALPPLSGPEGQPTGALYGLARILMKVLRDQRFSYIVAAFDRPEPTHRKEAFAAYKAHRPKAPDELVSQLVEARELFRAFNIPVVEMPKVEADDLIGALAVRFAKEGYEVRILTGDLDALQLVRDPMIKVETFKKGISETVIYDEAAVTARYGFGPAYIPDMKGIMGDASDNIPGVPGVGEGSALKLIRVYGRLENLYHALTKDGAEAVAKRADIQTRFAKRVAMHEKDAYFSRALATIDTEVPVSIPKEPFTEASSEQITAYFTRMGFESLLKGAAVAAPPRAEDKSPRTGKETKNIPPKNTIFVRDVNDARERLFQLAGPNEKIAYGWKEILKELGDDASRVAPPLFDMTVAGWIVDPDQTDFSPEALAIRLCGRAVNDETLYVTLKEKLHAYELEKVFSEIEMPLVPILAAMERAGIAVNRAALQKLSRAMQKELAELETGIFTAAYGPFNLNSPRQVAEVLFERLKLGTAKDRKTRTGQRRTGHEVLTELKDAHPVVPLFLRYRETYKIYSGFVLPLIDAVAKDGRVRTTFLQTGTATGRLASEHPNLQNIPQESKWAKPLRRAFIAPRGHALVSFDYSQLELRLLAHASGDEEMRRTFHRGEDIHAMTAARVFGTSSSGVTPAMRRTAKTLNFGIVYGMGIRAFAASSGLTTAEAKRFMEEYFRQFPGVRAWQARVKAEAKTNGYVTNENGRRRWFLHAAKRGRLGEVERAAINMPLQSLGADIIKAAMIRTRGLARVVHSVHDELLFEIPQGMLKAQIPAIREQMERAAHLSVPLRVDVKHGPDWGTMATWPDTHSPTL